MKICVRTTAIIYVPKDHLFHIKIAFVFKSFFTILMPTFCIIKYIHTCLASSTNLSCLYLHYTTKYKQSKAKALECNREKPIKLRETICKDCQCGSYLLSRRLQVLRRIIEIIFNFTDIVERSETLKLFYDVFKYFSRAFLLSRP